MAQQIDSAEFNRSMCVIKRVKNFFVFLILVALAVQISSFILAHYQNVLTDAAPILDKTDGDTNSPQPATAEKTRQWTKTINWALAISKFFAMVSGLLLVITIMYIAALSLFGGGLGTGSLFSAFFWSLILMAMLLPWQQILDANMFCGATFNLGDIIRWNQRLRPYDQALMKFPFYARFLGYPGLALVILTAVQIRFVRGYSRTVQPAQTAQPLQNLQ